ncbi:MFS transporter [Franconibacter helveticus]|uniref:MFS transporter n=1 Tax=Franconibacter helveticus TaxID=357240 RepID=UPI000DA1E096|nr:MFS transporter [Franconibacter helveticus]MDU6923798.1 MFS transporter [Franconibacter helveticus]
MSVTSHSACALPYRAPGWLILLFSVASGLAVANVYFAQPLLASMAADLHVSTQAIGSVVTVTQAGYAVGLLLLVPLGDLIDRRWLISAMMFAASLALTVVGFSGAFSALLVGMLATGLMAVVVQVFVASASALSPPGERGKAVGAVTGGIVLGILLARLAAGALADLAGWRAIYRLSAALIFIMAVVLWRVLPSQKAQAQKRGYRQILLSVMQLWITVRVLRVRAVLAMLVFMSFSLLWTGLVLPLSAAPWFFSHTQIGLFGLAGVAGALAALKAGRWADRGYGERTSGLALFILVASWLPVSMAGSSMLLLIVGIVLLDFAVQAVHVTNQSLIFAARPEAASRLVGAYMVFYSAGSGAGALLATMTYDRWGWAGVCLTGALVSLSAFIFWLLTRYSGK